ncbi:hypothetical protein ACSBR2_023184 [Camellia fascicularis]
MWGIYCGLTIVLKKVFVKLSLRQILLWLKSCSPRALPKTTLIETLWMILATYSNVVIVQLNTSCMKPINVQTSS